ncbi:MAG: heme biosynthesis HemY N-terminal domain-containing protein [Pseudomonadota bacterium]
MFRFLVFLLVVLGLGLLFAWVADNPGTIFLQWEWLANALGRPGEEVGIPLTTAIVAVILLIAIVMVITNLIKGVFGIPSFITKFFDNRRTERGYKALSRGLIAASSGDVDTARSLAKESGKLLKNEPLVALLGTQTALLEGKRDEATANFKTMLENDTTRMVALRGLFLEAERQGQNEAARHYAEEAAHQAPSLPWAGTAKLRYQATDSDWDSAIQTLEANRSAGLVDREKAKRHRAVLLTAKALSVEQADPDRAKKLAKEAHKLAKNLVPAATTYARAASRLGDIRGATKVIEAAWKQLPHPELAEAYATVRAGDSVKDRLKRAKKLAGLKPNHPEGSLAVAIAAIDAKAWDEARAALEPVLTTRPTERACILMADIEEGQHGDQGRMRDWLSRAVRAPEDEAWTADGHVSEEWMPVSPITGEIDAFEWKIPVAMLGGETAPVMSIEEFKEQSRPVAEAKTVSAAATAATTIINEDESIADEVAKEDEILEAELVDDSEESQETSDEGGKESNEPNAELLPETTEESAQETETEVPDNVVPIESAKPAEPSVTEEIASEDNGSEPKAESTKSEKPEEDQTQENSSPYENTVKFPLERRPDDPGPHPDKEPPKKGFKLF